MYLNIVQVAESFGVSEKEVEDWVRNDGLPHTLDRRRLLFDRAQVVDWAAQQGRASKAGFIAPEISALGDGLRIGPLLRLGGIWRDVPAAEIHATLERIVTALPGATPAICQMLGQRIRAPGGVVMAPVGGGFALPHPSQRIALGREAGIVALLLLRDALAPDEAVSDRVPVNRLLFFIAPSPRLHLDLLARLSRCLASEPVRGTILHAAPDAEILEAVDAADAAFAMQSNH